MQAKNHIVDVLHLSHYYYIITIILTIIIIINLRAYWNNVWKVTRSLPYITYARENNEAVDIHPKTWAKLDMVETKPLRKSPKSVIALIENFKAEMLKRNPYFIPCVQ